MACRHRSVLHREGLPERRGIGIADKGADGGSGAAVRRSLPAIDEQIGNYLRHGDSPRRDVAHPKFAVGDTVRITNVPAGAHTRLPGFLRGRIGTVERVFEGDYAYFWDTGDGIGDPMPVYIVEFPPQELWGTRAEPGPETMYAELFEAYLEGTE